MPDAAEMPNNLILNGFDRSGSSAVSRTLAQHPSIELIFQPFNGGSIRDSMYSIMTSSIATDQDVQFHRALEQGRLDTTYIKSRWFNKYSTATEFTVGKLHLIKTTINHLTAQWLNETFPAIEMWGLWRDPMDILASIHANGFHARWYHDAIEPLCRTVRTSELLATHFESKIEQLTTETRQTAFLIAARSYFFFHHLDVQKLLVYERFKSDPNHELGKLLAYFTLPGFDFRPYIHTDMNVTGRPYADSTRRPVLPAADVDVCEDIFSPLLTLARAKFNL